MLLNSNEYIEIIGDIKSQIHSAQYRAVMGANRELVLLYWNIGKTILAKSEWGNKFVENLSRDIRLEFPNTTGYSVRNLKYMRKFADFLSDEQFVQQLVAQIPWGHIINLLDKAAQIEEFSFYATETAKNGWSRSVLIHQIELNLYKRQALTQKSTNFKTTLPPMQSELAVGALKDPYVFDFVELQSSAIERDIENELVKNISALLLELGTGFAFVGNQY